MIGEICGYLKNYFVRTEYSGEFEIVGGEINLPLSYGQYYRITGSVMNDGVHQFPDKLSDETFEGKVYAMAVPAEFLALVADIEAWQKKNGEASPFQSESFAGYTYTRSAETATWHGAFKQRLARWRKL